MNEEIKVWQTQSVKHKVAMLLIMDGIVFTAPESYVKRMVQRLMNCYGCSLKPIINEVEGK